MDFVTGTKRRRQANPNGEPKRATTISDLPHVILCFIVSLLPLKDVMTGVLSKVWTNIWCSMPNWDLAYADFPRITNTRWTFEEFIENSRRTFEDFIERLIYFHTGPDIQTMRIAHHYYDTCSRRATMWIDYLTRNRILNLDIDIPMSLPFSLFSCDTLVVLKLTMHELCVRLPTNISLPSLEKLHLEEVIFDGASAVQRVLDGCPKMITCIFVECHVTGPTDVDIFINQPNLKHLSFISCHFFQQVELVLSALNLTDFRYKGMNFVLSKHSKISLSGIKDARLEVEEQFGRYMAYRWDGVTHVFGKNMSRILSVFRCVTTLLLSEWCIEYMSTISNTIDLPFFINLKSLYATICPNRGHAYMVVKLMNAAPCLEFLSIKSPDTPVPGIHHNAERLNYPDVPNFLRSIVTQYYLRNIELNKFGTSEHEMMLVRYFLRSSIDLEHLTIECASQVNVEMHSLFRRMICAFFRASPNVTIKIT